MESRSCLRLMLLGAIALLAVEATKTNKLLVFGDSWVDGGNLFAASNKTLPPAQFYWQGRFTDGWTLVDVAIVRSPFAKTTVNKAFARSVACQANNVLGGPFSVQSQVAIHIAGDKKTTLTQKKETAVFINAGGNDLFDVVPRLNTVNLPAKVQQIVSCMIHSVETLVKAGYDKVIINNLPNIGVSPLLVSVPNAVKFWDTVALQYNALLKAQLEGLKKKYRNSILGIYDEYKISKDIIDNPVYHGIKYSKGMCLTGAFTPAGQWYPTALCPNPGDWAFYDVLHPTSKSAVALGHKLLDTWKGLKMI